MKTKTGKKLLSAVLALMMIFSTGAVAFSIYATDETESCGDSARYTLTSNGILTIFGSGKISNNAFQNNSKIKRVIFEGNNITDIGENAFSSCQNLTNISLPESVKTVDKQAFESCVNLEEINIDYLTYIGQQAFNGCANLKRIGKFNEKEQVSVFCGAFAYCAITGEIDIPETVTLKDRNSGAKGIFEGCNYLQKAKVNTKSLPSMIFYSCKNLDVVELGENVKSIQSSAFSSSGLTQIVVPKNVESLGVRAFYGCDKLISADLSESNIKNIPDFCFNSCGNLERVLFPKELETIGEYSFKCCNKLVSIYIPSSVKTIYKEPFTSCNSLLKIEVEDGNDKYYSTTVDGEKTNAIIEKSDNAQENDYIIFGCQNTVVPKNVDISKGAFLGIDVKTFYIHSGIDYIGYDLGGFLNYYSETTDVYFEGTEKDWNDISVNYLKSDNITVHYNWDGSIKRTVCFNLMSAYASVEKLKYENQDSTGSIKLPVPKWDGHECLGWSLYPNATTAEYKCNEYFNTDINVTLYAIWEKTSSDPDIPQPPVEAEPIEKSSLDNNVKCNYKEGTFGTSSDKNLSLVVSEVKKGTSDFASFQAAVKGGEIFGLYSIKFTDGKNYYQPKTGQTVEVRIRIPEGVKTSDNIFIYHKIDDSRSERIKMDDGKVKFENGYIVFNTSSFSEFAVVVDRTISIKVDDVSLNYKSSAKIVPNITAYDSAKYTVEYSTSNPDVVTVDKDGNVTTLHKGTATITCTVTDEYGNVVKDTCNVNVTFSFGQWLIWILLLGFLWY